jgi:probable F420-dependent oxidoreductase
MKFGISIPTWGPMASPEPMEALARRADELGFGFLSVADHIVLPKQVSSRYPYSETGEYTGDGYFMDQLTVLGFLAAHTSRIRLVTSVMVLPYRNPIHTAKMLSTIDVLSQGRLTVGCGVGWMREEFEVLNSPPFEERGVVGDEYIEAFRELWTNEEAVYEGKHVKFSDMHFNPKPVQKPYPPIWVGGESAPAMRRAARLGDGWFPIASNPRHPLATVEQLSAALTRLRRYAEKVDRDPDEIDIAYNSSGLTDWQTSPEKAAEQIRAFQDLGVRHISSSVGGATLNERTEQMEQFAAEVMPLV